MDPTTFLTVVGSSGLALVAFAAFVFYRSIRGVRSSTRYTAPPEF